MKLKAFKDLLFFNCYDCGWGEKGVSDSCLTFEEAYSIIKEVSGVECADRFEKEEEDYFDYGINHYMVSKRHFVEADWEGSQDY